MKKKAFFKWGIFLSIVISCLLGCGGKGKSVKTVEGDPELLYKQALARFNKRDYSEALKQFEQLKSSFPDSPPYTILAELKVGDCHFFKKDYVEAIAAYEEFKKIHPTHAEIPYVQYQIGMAYFNQMLTPDRDQTPTKKALSNFEYLIANTPPSLFTEKAKEKVGVCRRRLVDHEFYIGNFYYKHGKFHAAVARFEGLLEKFPKNPEEDKALYLLGKSYLELEQGEKAKEAFTKIVNEYPKSPHYKEARAILNKGMTEKKVSLRKTKAKEAKKKGDTEEAGPERIALIKFEEERKQVVSLNEEKDELRKVEGGIAPISAPSELAKPTSPAPSPKVKSELEVKLAEEKRVAALPSPPTALKEKSEREVLPEPEKGNPVKTGQPTIPPKTKLEIEIKPDEEKRVIALPNTPSPPKEETKKGVLPEHREVKLGDTDQPIDITSDRVEAYAKKNLIVFKGNVMARQRDIVIYADSIEAVIIEDGKGIEKIVAGGNVKIQQGLRVASCQKAIFYNLDQKVILTGDPKVWEGDNIVSGDEIIFDIEKNQIEVKGGPSGRGKAKIHPGGEFEKPK
ncbi:MAG: lipopolysaccharide transport periplasmic protein LptA [Thermodesulfobacteriota bacterium]